jgi:O-acetyl-ADP-ribose deacetylase (regulator of RNase III)
MKEQLIDELIEYFISEDSKYLDIMLPKSLKDKRSLLRGLINLREPKSIPPLILEKEDKLLQLELKEKKIIDVLSLKEKEENIAIYLGDITTLKADAIVNAGNSYGLGCFIPNHHCIDNAIHSYAGIRLRLECNELLKGRELNNGEIIVTSGYNLPASYVITTVGPCIDNYVTNKDKQDLSNCYKNALMYAINHHFKSIVFPSISTGIFSYPLKEAKVIAYNSVKEILKDYKIKVIFDLYSKEDYDEYEALFNDKRKN